MITEAPFEHPGLGRVCDPADHQEHTNRRLCRGEDHESRESEARGAATSASGHIWCFKLNRLYARDAAVDGNVARFINHSCRPNCYVQVVGETIWIRAAKNIRRGRRADLRLQHRGRGFHPVPVPARLQGHPVMHVLYLHGFASSAQSSKAAFFRSKLSAHGVEVQTPDFNAPDFSTLTVSRMLGQVHDAIEAAAAGSRGAHRIEPRRVRRRPRRAAGGGARRSPGPAGAGARLRRQSHARSRGPRHRRVAPHESARGVPLRLRAG